MCTYRQTKLRSCIGKQIRVVRGYVYNGRTKISCIQASKVRTIQVYICRQSEQDSHRVACEESEIKPHGVIYISSFEPYVLIYTYKQN